MTIRITCPDCQRPVAMSARGRLHRHGSPPCRRSNRPVGRIWPTWFNGRRVQIIPGPDTEDLTQGAA